MKNPRGDMVMERKSTEPGSMDGMDMSKSSTLVLAQIKRLR